MKIVVDPPIGMFISLVGFAASAIYTASGAMERYFFSLGFGENFGMSLGFAFCIVFIMMFIATFISGLPTEEELKEL